MPRDFEDIFDLDGLSDAELRDLVRQEMEKHDGLDADSIVVHVSDGLVRLAGRVGTDGERQIADHLLSDVIGLPRYENELVVDPIHRDEASEDAEEASADRAEGSGEPLGRPRASRDDASVEEEDELDARLYGTHDVGSAIEQGTAWVPPEAPTQEGYGERIGNWDPQDEEPDTRG
jgi:hypothetical protein